MNPIFSIIVPAYNVADYIEKAIDSCLNQKNISGSEYEIIVINDGSTDDTLQKLSKYNHINNIKLISQTNSGLSATRNKGVSQASGQYILFLDGDDWFVPDALSILKSNISEVDVVIFSMTYCFPGEKPINNSLGLKHDFIYTSDKLLKDTIGRSQFQSCPAPTKCYKSDLFKEKGLSFIEGILHEDGPFYLECLSKSNKIKYIEEFLYCYRQQRPGSITTSKRKWRNVEGIIKGQQHVFNIYGYSNKDVNYYYLAISEMQIFQKYQSKEDYQMVVDYFSKYKTRFFLFRALINFRFENRTFWLGLLLILFPSLAGSWYCMKHKLYR